MSVLTIVQSVMGRLSFTAPSIVATSPDRNVQQFFQLLCEEAESLSKRGSPSGWQSLQQEWTFVTTATALQTNTPIPPDLRRIQPDSVFNRSTNRQVTGPLTPQQYQRAQVWPQLVAPYLTYRERNGEIYINPTPPAGETIAYEYISSYWAQNNAGAAKATFTSDDDGTYLDEELLKLGLRWRWKAAKGLDYGEDMATYERAVDLALGDDGGSGSLDIGGPAISEPIWRANIPEGNWGV